MATDPQHSAPDRDPQATAAWLAFLDRVTEGRTDQRRTWTDEEAFALLTDIGRAGQSVIAVTSRLYGDVTSPEKAQDVERFGDVDFRPETTPGGAPVLAMRTPNRFLWVTPATVTYLPCPASPADGVFVVSVADMVTAAPGAKLPFGAYLQSASGAGQKARWLGGLVLTNRDGRVEQHLPDAPDEVWFDFPALVRWAGRLLDAPPPRTTAEGLDDPAVMDTLAEALAHHRQTTGTTRRGAKATQGDVDAIARAAIVAGLQPTVALLIRVLGRGSASTIHPLLKSFYRRAVPEGLLPGAEPPPAPDLPPTFLDLLDQLRAAARAELDAALAPQRAALAEREAAAAAREAEHTAAQAELAREREQLTAAAEERDRTLARLETELTAARERIETLTHVELGQTQELTRVAAERDALREQHAAAVANSNALAERLEQRQADLASAADTLATERLAAAQASAAAAAHAAELSQRLALATADAEHRQAVAQDLTAQLAEARTRVADREHDVADLQQRLHAQADAQALAQRLTAETNARMTELGETAARRRAELERAQADLAAVTRERDRLDTLVRQLHADAPRPVEPAGGKSKRP